MGASVLLLLRDLVAVRSGLRAQDAKVVALHVVGKHDFSACTRCSQTYSAVLQQGNVAFYKLGTKYGDMRLHSCL